MSEETALAKTATQRFKDFVEKLKNEKTTLTERFNANFKGKSRDDLNDEQVAEFNELNHSFEINAEELKMCSFVLEHIQTVEENKATIFEIIDLFITQFRPDLSKIVTTLVVDVLASIGMDIQKEFGEKFGKQLNTRWAQDLREKYDALIEAKFSPADAMEIIKTTDKPDMVSIIYHVLHQYKK